MNYHRLYFEIINHRKNNPAQGYTEKHHVLPRSLGGTDEKANLVALTAREHFVCHYLLTKMYTVDSYEWHKMNHAFMLMKGANSKHRRYFNSRLYESVRQNFRKVMSRAQSGSQNSQHGTRWIHSIVLEKSKKIGVGEPLPKNWNEGRVINFAKLREKTKNKQAKQEEKVAQKKKQKKKLIQKLLPLYKRYAAGESLQSVAKDYKFSYVSLYKNFKKYFPDIRRETGRGNTKGR